MVALHTLSFVSFVVLSFVAKSPKLFALHFSRPFLDVSGLAALHILPLCLL